MRDLTAGRPIRCLITRAVAFVAHINHAAARHEFIAHEAIGAAANHFADLRAGIGFGQALRHDEGHIRVGLRQRIQQKREGALQANFKRAIIRGAPFIHLCREDLPEGITPRPACQ